MESESFRLQLYNSLSTPTFFDNIRYFKFDMPLVLKRSTRTVSTEAHALRFLNNRTLDLPIPRIIDSIVVGGETFTLMTRIPGELLVEKVYTMSDVQLRIIFQDVFTVLHSFWTLQQPRENAGTIMLSASGHGLPSPVRFSDDLEGPYDSVLACYAHMSSHLVRSAAELEQLYPTAAQALMADAIVYVHTDLRSHNILVKDGRLSGIIDWEDSGWLPRNWQLHVIRRLCRSTPGNLKRLIDEMKGPAESEVAYEQSKLLLYYAL